MGVLALRKSPLVSTQTLDAMVRSNFACFVPKAFSTVSPGDTYAPNWHLQAMCHNLSKVIGGDIKRLIITVPPRYLKSICTSVALPAFILGHDPTRRIICVSYSQELAVKHANDCRSVMKADYYQRIFPGTRIDPSKDTQTEVLTTRRGFRLATSVGGTLTGRGGNLIIIDDPIKPSDAMSDVSREGSIEWFRTTLMSRLDDKENDAIILVMQRRHVGDVAGHLLDLGGWHHLNLPAIAEVEERIEIAPGRYHTRKVGELLHPARESQATLDAMKTTMGSATFAAQYQQSPVPPGGNMIDWKWFQWFDPDDPTIDNVAISWDTAMKPTELSDYSVGTVWTRKGDTYYLLDVIRARLDFPGLKRKVIEVYERWRPFCQPTLLIEEAGSGTSLLQELRVRSIPAIPIRPKDDKIMRMSEQCAKIEAGAVYLPRNAPWLGDLKAEVLAFPHGLHDDQVDSISQALKWLSYRRREPLWTSVPTFGSSRSTSFDYSVAVPYYP
jgi:predicted phage terminase large subunit-like protein